MLHSTINGSMGRNSQGHNSIGKDSGCNRGMNNQTVANNKGLLELLNFRGSQGSSTDMKNDTDGNASIYMKDEIYNSASAGVGAVDGQTKNLGGAVVRHANFNSQFFTSKPNLKPKTPLNQVSRTGRMKSNVVAEILNKVQRTVETAGGAGMDAGLEYGDKPGGLMQLSPMVYSPIMNHDKKKQESKNY